MKSLRQELGIDAEADYTITGQTIRVLESGRRNHLTIPSYARVLESGRRNHLTILSCARVSPRAFLFDHPHSCGL